MGSLIVGWGNLFLWLFSGLLRLYFPVLVYRKEWSNFWAR
ncbi:hypothetical protein M6B38_312390 [Iris pallida]|uniref:ATP synthase F0 subunit 8 n=1 Tax=Iris pallida TaxID=29817 RepID=A0AAX6HH32_IRIPA|nr:hypothetical protein M6B38_312390 [Iris pallida]